MEFKKVSPLRESDITFRKLNKGEYFVWDTDKNFLCLKVSEDFYFDITYGQLMAFSDDSDSDFLENHELEITYMHAPSNEVRRVKFNVEEIEWYVLL